MLKLSGKIKGLPSAELVIQLSFVADDSNVYDISTTPMSLGNNTHTYLIESDRTALTNGEAKIRVYVDNVQTQSVNLTDKNIDLTAGNNFFDFDYVSPTSTTPTPSVEYPKPQLRFKRLRGQLFDQTGTNKNLVANRQVVVWARDKEKDDVVIVMLAQSDKRGNFFGDLPLGLRDYHLAVLGAKTSGMQSREDTVNKGMDIGMAFDPNYMTGTGNNLLIVPVEASSNTTTGTDEHDCSCLAELPSLPNAEELVGSYKQDIGAGCVDFTTPNRALEEFSYFSVVRTSTPTVKSFTLAQLEGTENEPQNPIDHAPNNTTIGEGANGSKLLEDGTLPAAKKRTAIFPITNTTSTTERMTLGANKQIDWDNSPTIFQAIELGFGHLIQYKQVWKADGYSLGDLLYSLPLAPGQKKQIAIFDWDRTESNTRSEDTRFEESLDAHLSRDRDVNEISKASLSENVRGQSTANTSSRSGGFGVAGGAFGPGAFIGVAGGASWNNGSASSTASNSANRNASSQALQSLRDRVMQGASSIRNQRSTVVNLSRQGEKVTATTEVVANHNHCHALTMQYFEVLRHFAVENTIADVKECVFVPLQMSLFTAAKVMRWFDILRPLVKAYTLPQGKDVRAQAIDKGLDAIERIYNDYEGSDIPNTTYAAESIQEIWGEFELYVKINRPADRKVLPPLPDSTSATTTENGTLEYSAFYQNILDNHTSMANYLKKFTFYEIEEQNWFEYCALTGTTMEEVRNTFEDRPYREWDTIFRNIFAPRILEALINNSLSLSVVTTNNSTVNLNADFTLLSDFSPIQNNGKLAVRFAGGATAVRVSFMADPSTSNIRRDAVRKVKLSTTANLVSTNYSKAVLQNVNIQYRTKHYQGTLLRGAAKNDISLGDDAIMPTPLATAELVNPRWEDRKYATALLHHLNSRMEEYHKALWMNMDVDRRYLLLDGVKISHTDLGTNASLATVVENTLIGIVGNSLVFPLALGVHFTRTKAAAEAQGALLDIYRPEDLPPPFRVSVPTRGVFCEAVMGSCNACEKIDDTRFWKWEEHPNPDDPTAINAVSLDSRYQSPQNMTPTAMPQPLISIQNAPDAPAFNGANGLLNLLSTPGIFKDLSGLDANQQNAIRALQIAAESAQGFTSQASNMANTAAGLESQKMSQDHQEKMTQKKYAQDNYDRIKDRLDTQLKNGEITREDYNKRLQELNDLTLGATEQSSSSSNSSNSNSTPSSPATKQFQNVMAELSKLSDDKLTALMQNPSVANAIASLIKADEDFNLDNLSDLLANYANSQVGESPIV